MQNDFTRISLEESSCLIATEAHGVSQDFHYLMCSERNNYVMLLFTAVRMKFKLGATTEFNGKFCSTQSFSSHAVWAGYGWDASAEASWELSPTLAYCGQKHGVTWNNSSPEK